jgi:hypothetical protein
MHTNPTSLSPLPHFTKPSPQTPFSPTPLLRLKLQSLPPIDPSTPLLPAAIQPLLQVLTLTNIKSLQNCTPFHHGLDAYSSNAYTAPHTQFFEFKEMKPDGAERGVRDCRPTEGKLEGTEVRTAQGEDFGCGIGEGAAE